MSAFSTTLQTQWAQARAEWEASARLRVGLWAVLGIGLLWLLLLLLDACDAGVQRLQTREAELQRLTSAAKGDLWGQRLAQGQDHLAAVQGMVWSEPELGLSEAAFQDWLREVSSRLGLKARELQVSRIEAGKLDQKDPLPTDTTLLRARMVVDLQRGPLFSFLAEVARNERSIVVERLVMRAQSQPATAEIELRALARRPGATP
ncbi:hypothetical protein ACS5PK_19695 [Roseateles sp. DB2]|uniref:hypothetical protein n=1 Tax=Roseateles sp. DB2 TaxID=3453717 RepID=UPI003EEF4295